MKGPIASSVDDYLATVEPEAFRTSLQRLREVIHEESPDAAESISYGMPTFKLDGSLVYFAAFKNHCSFFPGTALLGFENELREFKTSKGTIQFTPEKPIPEEVVRAILRARIADGLAKKRPKKS